MWFSKRRRVFKLLEGEEGREEVKEREGGVKYELTYVQDQSQDSS